MNGEMRLIECEKIQAPRKDSLSSATLGLLENSLRVDGLLQPIILRPDPEKPGHFIIVAGKHRFYVKSKILQAEAIEARVFEDMDEQEAKLATLSENLCRNHLTHAKRVKQLQEWQALYRAKYPEAVGPKAGGHATQRKRREASEAKAAELTGAAAEGTAKQEGEGAEPAAKPKPEPAAKPKPQSFRDRAAQATGQSKRSVDRDLALAKLFTPDELEVFDQTQVSRMDVVAVSEIKDPAQRSHAVRLIGLGLEPADAIAHVTGQEDGATAAGGQAEGDGRPDAALSDDEWFEQRCGSFRDLLVQAGNRNPARYRTDAILFRRIADVRREFRRKVKKDVEAARDSKMVGLFFVTVNRLISFSHPRSWLMCEFCRGSGECDGKECRRCIGAGYHATTEKYL